MKVKHKYSEKRSIGSFARRLKRYKYKRYKRFNLKPYSLPACASKVLADPLCFFIAQNLIMFDRFVLLNVEMRYFSQRIEVIV